jgi:hypothetical protein
VRISSHRKPERPRQPKIGELEVVMLVDEKVLGFEVAVQDTAGMAVHQAKVELVREFLDNLTQSVESKRVSECIDAKDASRKRKT